MKFEIEGAEAVELRSPQIILVGYSGRNADEVRAHIDELAQHGVPAPAEVPAVWEVPTDLLRQEMMIEAPRSGTSGEAEPVLLLQAGQVFVTVGSDHTDRQLERTQMDRAKRAFPKIVARRCWPLNSARPAWDQIALSSDVEVNGQWRRYQEGFLSQLLQPEWFVERFGGREDTVIFCGTVPALHGMETAADGFRASLYNPVTRQQLSCLYRIRTRP